MRKADKEPSIFQLLARYFPGGAINKAATIREFTELLDYWLMSYRGITLPQKVLDTMAKASIKGFLVMSADGGSIDRAKSIAKFTEALDTQLEKDAQGIQIYVDALIQTYEKYAPNGGRINGSFLLAKTLDMLKVEASQYASEQAMLRTALKDKNVFDSAKGLNGGVKLAGASSAAEPEVELEEGEEEEEEEEEMIPARSFAGKAASKPSSKVNTRR